jgi:hypothetical protein
MEGICSGQGLLYFAGLNSEKHEGQLKRITAPAISLIKWLVTQEFKEADGSEAENVFYGRFIQLPVSVLAKINFAKHITQGGGVSSSGVPGAGGISGGFGGKFNKAKLLTGQSRMGNSEDAMALLAILLRDHRTPEGQPDPVDTHTLLGGDRDCIEKLQTWMQQEATVQVQHG